MKEDDKPKWDAVPPELRDRCFFSSSTDSKVLIKAKARLFALMVETWPQLKSSQDGVK